MYKLSNTPTREQTLKFISQSASFGNLGLFIGAGFSKAVLNDEFSDIALSWGELLSRSSEKIGVDYEKIWKEGVSYPEIATSICEENSLLTGNSYDDCLRKLKREICALTSWYPDKKKREEYSKYLLSMDSDWIITTNYDLVIESLLTGKSITLGPKDQLITPTNITPVYHLHGVRINPDSIIISQEDYVALFRPTEYRQIKLALTIKESTVLIVGYGLGDVNVLTALDWSNNVFREEESNYPHDVIQVLRKDNPKEEPYREKNGILIIETDNLDHFFSEFSGVRTQEKKREEKETESLNKLASALNDPEQSMIDKFIDEEKFRREVLNILSKFQIHIISGFVSFLNKCIDETWQRSVPNGAFEGYNQNLKIILDILVTFSVDSIPPALFETSAYGLERVGYYVNKDGDREHGKSFSATRTWRDRKKEISIEMVEELRNYSEQHWHSQLLRLIESINA
jgi:hypothetical protein